MVNTPSARPVELFESLGNVAALSSFHLIFDCNFEIAVQLQLENPTNWILSVASVLQAMIQQLPYSPGHWYMK